MWLCHCRGGLAISKCGKTANKKLWQHPQPHSSPVSHGVFLCTLQPQEISSVIITFISHNFLFEWCHEYFIFLVPPLQPHGSFLSCIAHLLLSNQFRKNHPLSCTNRSNYYISNAFASLNFEDNNKIKLKNKCTCTIHPSTNSLGFLLIITEMKSTIHPVRFLKWMGNLIILYRIKNELSTPSCASGHISKTEIQNQPSRR